MLLQPNRREIDNHTAKLIVGCIALSMGGLTSYLAGMPLPSISASYHAGGASHDVFVGFLFAISAFLLSYNGDTRPQMVSSKFAGVAGLLIALFPCKCDSHPEIVPGLHGGASFVMFGVLAYFCYVFFKRGRINVNNTLLEKPARNWARLRTLVYAVSGCAIVLSIVIMLVEFWSGGAISARIGRIVFYCESTALYAFGASWFAASEGRPLVNGYNQVKRAYYAAYQAKQRGST